MTSIPSKYTDATIRCQYYDGDRYQSERSEHGRLSRCHAIRRHIRHLFRISRLWQFFRLLEHARQHTVCYAAEIYGEKQQKISPHDQFGVDHFTL